MITLAYVRYGVDRRSSAFGWAKALAARLLAALRVIAPDGREWVISCQTETRHPVLDTGLGYLERPRKQKKSQTPCQARGDEGRNDGSGIAS